MISKADSIQNAFLRGDHQAVLDGTVDSPGAASFRKNLRYVIGSLSFLGRIEEARALFESHTNSTDPRRVLSIDEVFAARFFLGVGFCRHSRYQESRQFIFENLKFGRRSADPTHRFYAYQGLGFYRFFCGRFGLALSSARKASLAALQSEYLWGKLLSSDLMGHALVQTGEVSLGTRTLAQAMAYAKHLGDGGVQQALRVALACIDAQFGLTPQALSQLEQLGGELRDQDTYSHAALLLEKARLHGLRGELESAREALNQSSRHIYGSRNRRQSVVLNVRYAQLHFLQGEPDQALNLLLNSDRDLVRGVDNALELEAAGVKLKIGLAAGVLPQSAIIALRQRIQFLTHYTGKGTAKRILARPDPGGLPAGLAKAGDDPLGDLLDRFKRPDFRVFEDTARAGYLGLIYDLAALSRSGQAICVDLLPGRLLVLDRGSVWHVPESLSPMLRKLLRALAEAPAEISKEDLIFKVWGYAYRPIQHDPLIYSTVSRVRQLLGPYDFWIEATENGYRLRKGVELRFAAETPAHAAPSGVPRGKAAARLPEIRGVIADSQLNARQIQLLRHLKSHEFVGPKDCVRMFDVSEITASRDLAALREHGLVQRVGRGRATRYRVMSLRSGGQRVTAPQSGGVFQSKAGRTTNA